ncbi:MAG: DUF262 domain-containing protein [Microcoleaceae cyanobacterium]
MSSFLTKEDFEKIFTSHLKIEPYSKSIDSLFSLRNLNKIDYKPYYQRNYVWDDDKATYFIESILLGTEIPPLIFFKNSSKIEVIDGRQRFETIKRFKDNEFSLTKNGLAALKQLVKENYQSLQANSETKRIIDLFLDAKIRIIEFEIVNEPPLDSAIEDKVKKEIFGRYNSGITPLKKAEIDNAVYDENLVFQNFKNWVKENSKFCEIIHNLFLPERESKKSIDTGKVLQFIRRYLVLHQFPIKYYSWGNNRTETLDKLYEHTANQVRCKDEADQLCNSFAEKVYRVNQIKGIFEENNFTANRLVFECLLWILHVLEAEGIDVHNIKNNDRIERLGKEISDNFEKFVNYQNYTSYIFERFSFIAKFFEEEFNVNLSAYVDGDRETRDELNRIRRSESDDTVTKLGELAYLRVTKPEPSRNSIDDIKRMMERNKFLVRPSYQRAEVISIFKASSIIESILLDISLPPIFIYKRKDGVSEVIDGQQRLLTILGFIEAKYVDENGYLYSPKNSGFSLKGLKILNNLNKKKYQRLDMSLQDKILDFQLFVVEIEESINPEFNPVDLFVRLNNKPYPIRENSFEMWNSWVARELIETIKNNFNKYREWFYIKRIKTSKSRDRMENEELYTSLAYLEYQRIKSKEDDKHLYIYNVNNGISVRISSSLVLTKLLQTASENEEVKSDFIQGIKNLESFIKKVKLVLLDKDIEGKEKLNQFLDDELNSLFKANRQIRSFARTRKAFYILWYLLSKLNFEMVKFHRLEIKKDLQNIFYALRNNSEDFTKEKFLREAQNFQTKYSVDSRKTKLSDAEKLEKLKEQGNCCPISEAPLFMGDDIDVDHNMPLSIGGADSKDNLQITHSDSNRKKGSKSPSDS